MENKKLKVAYVREVTYTYVTCPYCYERIKAVFEVGKELMCPFCYNFIEIRKESVEA